MAEKRTLVRCTVSPGFFAAEVLVLVAGSSAYVSRDDVKVNGAISGPVDGMVYAYVIQSDKDKALVELPGEAVVGVVRTWVPKTLLAATA